MTREQFAVNRTDAQSQAEDDEIEAFNQNTDYDDRAIMNETEPVVEDTDPFSPHNLAIQQFIMTSRVYDVLLALLKLTDDDVARDLLELHSAGHLLGPSPNFSGAFLTDDMNEEPGTDENN